MKTLSVFLHILLMVTAVHAGSELAAPCPECMPEFLETANPAVVMVLCYEEPSKRHIQGTGFFINRKGEVLTSNHVVAGQKKIQIRTAEQKSYLVKRIIEEDIFGDLAKLEVDIPNDAAVPLRLSSKQAVKGEEVTIIGYPLGHRQSVASGEISSLFPIAGLGNLMQFTAPMTSGSSGSPVLNLSGEVIGVASFMLFPASDLPSLNYAVPVGHFEN